MCDIHMNNKGSVRYNRALQLIHANPNESLVGPCNSRTGMEKGGAGVYMAVQNKLWEESSRPTKQSQFYRTPVEFAS